MDIKIPEFYIFIAGIIILILMIGMCFYYFWLRRSIVNTKRVITGNSVLNDNKKINGVWLQTLVDNKYWVLYEDDRGFHITEDYDKMTKFIYHNRDSNVLKDLKIQIPSLTKQTMALESSDSILEIRYIEENKVNAILRYQKHTGYVIRYFHIVNGKLILDGNSNNQVIFEVNGQ